MTARAKQSWAALTDIGRVRTHNEDAVLAQPPLFVVADGMGGHQRGDVAANLCIDSIRDWFSGKVADDIDIFIVFDKAVEDHTAYIARGCI